MSVAINVETLGDSFTQASAAPRTEASKLPKRKGNTPCLCDPLFCGGIGSGLLMMTGITFLVLASLNNCLTVSSESSASSGDSSSSSLYSSTSSSPDCSSGTTIAGIVTLAGGFFCFCSLLVIACHKDKKREYQKL